MHNRVAHDHKVKHVAVWFQPKRPQAVRVRVGARREDEEGGREGGRGREREREGGREGGREREREREREKKRDSSVSR